MPRKSSPRKTSPQPTETQPAMTEVAAIRTSVEKSASQAESVQPPASGPVLVAAETNAPRKSIAAPADGAGASPRPEKIDKPSQVLSPSQQEAIRRRAFEIYQQRGGRSGGNAVDDWLRAERELLASAKSNKDKRQPA